MLFKLSFSLHLFIYNSVLLFFFFCKKIFVVPFHFHRNSTMIIVKTLMVFVRIVFSNLGDRQKIIIQNLYLTTFMFLFISISLIFHTKEYYLKYKIFEDLFVCFCI